MPPTVLESYGGLPGPGSEWIPAAFASVGESDGAITGHEPAAEELAARLASGARIALLVSGRPPVALERAPLMVRVLRRARIVVASVRVRRKLAAAERRLCGQGRSCRRLLIGDRNDGYELGIDRAGVRLPVQAVLVLSNGGKPTLLDRSLATAGELIGEPLEVAHCRVLAGGTLMAELAGRSGAGEGRWFLRFHDEAPATAAFELLLASDLPPEVRDRLVSPLATGTDGGLGWSVEEKVAGIHPGALDSELWRESAAFLTALAGVPGTDALDAPGSSLAPDVTVLAPHLGERERARLGRIASVAGRRLEPVPRRWGHGDFHPGNLIVREGQLVKVLDWDAASPQALPGLDLLHLIATTDPVMRRLPHGARCSGPLPALVLGTGGRELRAWLEVEGVRTDPETLRALVVAYWLGRVARDLRTFPDRAGRGEWLELNVRRPVDALAARLDGE